MILKSALKYLTPTNRLIYNVIVGISWYLPNQLLNRKRYQSVVIFAHALVLYLFIKFKVQSWENYYEILPAFYNRITNPSESDKHYYETIHSVYNLNKHFSLRVRFADLDAKSKRLEFLDKFLQGFLQGRRLIGEDIRQCQKVAKWLLIDLNTVLLKVSSVFCFVDFNFYFNF